MRDSKTIVQKFELCRGDAFPLSTQKCIEERLKEYDFIDEKAELELYGTKPIFIYHKLDKSNRPIRGYHKSVIN